MEDKILGKDQTLNLLHEMHQKHGNSLHLDLNPEACCDLYGHMICWTTFLGSEPPGIRVYLVHLSHETIEPSGEII
jgi:hypothetical protein